MLKSVLSLILVGLPIVSQVEPALAQTNIFESSGETVRCIKARAKDKELNDKLYVAEAKGDYWFPKYKNLSNLVMYHTERGNESERLRLVPLLHNALSNTEMWAYEARIARYERKKNREQNRSCF